MPTKRVATLRWRSAIIFNTTTINPKPTMKRNKLILTLLALCGLLITSCKPQTPVDEPKNKLHDNPARMEITLFRTHFHGMQPHASGNTEGVKYGANQQTMILELKAGEGFVISPKGVPAFIVTGNRQPDYPAPAAPEKQSWTDGTFAPDKVNSGHTQYGMIIRYFNAAGEEITGQFATGGQEQIHQHFFIAKNIRPLKGSRKAAPKADPLHEYYYYYYFDTNPWNKMIREGSKFTGISNPIGLKGYFEFYQPESAFDLNILLLHARGSKYNSKTGKASPFTGPTPGQKLKDDFDLNVTIPVYVYADEDDFENVAFKSYESLTDEEHHLVQLLAESAGISEREAFDNLYQRVNGPIPPHDPSIGLGL